jgi:hypothetical protein
MRNTGGDRVIPLWRGGGCEVRVNPPGEKSVDLNIVFGPEYRQTLGELHHPSLGRRVGWGDTTAKDRRHGADIDDFAPTRLEHVWIHGTRAQEDTGEVGIQHLLPLFQGVILRRLADVDPGVIPTVSPLMIPLVYCHINSFQRASSVEKPLPGGENRIDGRASHPVEL